MEPDSDSTREYSGESSEPVIRKTGKSEESKVLDTTQVRDLKEKAQFSKSLQKKQVLEGHGSNKRTNLAHQTAGRFIPHRQFCLPKSGPRRGVNCHKRFTRVTSGSFPFRVCEKVKNNTFPIPPIIRFT